MLLKLTIKDILKQRTFAIIAIVSGLVLGIIYYLLTFEMGFSHLISDIELLAVHMSISILLTGIVAILAGINIALVAYNIKAQRSMNVKKNGVTTFLGGTLTAFTPGCPACTTSLAAQLGIGGGLAIFPLHGLELKFISISALIFSIWWAMRSINKASCCEMRK